MHSDIDATMLEMFRSEVETHLGKLSEGLLALERDPGRTDCCEALMRAAHSIKGAAKIVGLPAAVTVAHAIEDCFVAVRTGRQAMSSELIDLLLDAVDLLGRTAEVDGQGGAVFDAANPHVAGIVDRMAAAMQTISDGAAHVQLTGHMAQPAGASLRIRPQGRLDAAWASAHRDQVVALLRHQVGDIRIDLSDVTSLDAASLAFLSLAADRAGSPGATHRLQLLEVSPDVRQVLQAAGLDKLCGAAAAKGNP